METNLIAEGFKFMGLGMATVFAFLTTMIICMNVMSYIIQKFFPQEQQKDTKTPAPQQPQQQNNKKIVAAITAAIIHHKQG